jgi:AcrR family transcriptional regulator
VPRGGGEKRKTTLVEEAIRQFGREGYHGASLDQIATGVGVRKQTLLYYFPTKDALLEACLSAAGERLVLEIAQALEGKETYWDRAEAVIHSVFSLAEQWPEFPMFIREAGRLGPDAFARFATVLDPLRRRAIDFLQSGMDTGEIRKQDPAMLLFTLYTGVVGSLTEASVLNVVVGADKGRASLKRREKEVIAFVRAALEPPVGSGPPAGVETAPGG